MTLLDRFRAQPPQKNSDPVVRLAYVQEIPIDERNLLAEIARDDADPRVRRAAVAKLMDPSALASVADTDPDPAVRDRALTMLRDIALDLFEGIAEAESLAAVEALSDARMLATVAKTALREEVALRALGRVSEAHALGSIARHAGLEPIRLAALAALQDRGEIVSVALNSDFRDTGLAAVERLEDRGDLEQVATRAKNKSAQKRARTVLREMDERTAVRPVVAGVAEPPREREEREEREEDSAALLREEHGEDTLQAEQRSAVARPRDEGNGVTPPREESHAVALMREEGNAVTLPRDEGDAVTPPRDEGHTVTPPREERGGKKDRPDETARPEMEVMEVMEAAEASADPARAEPAGQAEQAARRREEYNEKAAAEAERQGQQKQARHQREEQAEEERRRKEEHAAQERQRQAERAEAQAREARVRQEALARVTELAGRVEALAARGDLALKAGERALRDVRTALGSLPALPSKREHDEMVDRLKRVQTALAARVQELRELTEWQRWANLGVLEQLCVQMEALSSLEDPLKIARQVHELQEQWRAASDVPRPQGDALWRRFKAAHDVVWARCAAHFAAEAEVRVQNLARKVALCEKAEALADSRNWIQTAEEIKGLQLEWKSIGVVTRGQEKTIWERFRGACDRFFTRRQADLAEHRKRWAENLAKKEALCAQVEALADSTDWDATASEIRRLQNEWKTIGPVKKSRSETIWLRFRSAGDRFFARHAQRHEIARGERVAAREAICAELESLAVLEIGSPGLGESEGRGTAQQLLTAVRSLRARWQQEIDARGVDRDRAAVLDQRFAAAFAGVLAAVPAAFAGSDLDPDTNRKRMEALVKRVEDLAGPTTAGGAATDAALSPSTRLAEMLKEALAANTIGGKVDEESRIRAATEEVRQAQASWTRIGPVPDDVRRALTDRFARACRRIAEKAGAAGAAGGAGRAGGARPAGVAGRAGEAGAAGRTGGKTRPVS